MILPDPRRSRAVLVGAARYATMPNLPAITANLTRLAELFRDDRVWGLPQANIDVLAEPPSPAVVLDTIRSAAAAAEDTLVVYYAGHGLLDSSDELLLALPETDMRRPYTAVRFDDVRSQVRSAHRRSAKVVILDCCYAARAMAGGMGSDQLGPDSLATRAAVEGSYLVVAASETRTALAPPGENYTAFTGELIKILEHGIEDAPELITVDQMYWRMRGELLAKGRPRPEQRARNQGAQIVLARNRHHGHRAVPQLVPAEPVVKPEAELQFTLPELLAEVERLRAAGATAAADNLLVVAGRAKSDQEAAALLLRLLHDPRDAGLVVGGVAQRSLTDLPEVLSLLMEMGAETVARSVLELVADGPVERTVELAVALSSTEQLDSVLLRAAVTAMAQDRPERIIDLVGGLSALGQPKEADLVITAAANCLVGLDAAAVADALHLAGRDREAAQLYASAAGSLAGRDPGQLALIARHLTEHGLSAAVGDLVSLAVDARGTVAERADLVKAFAPERSGPDLGWFLLFERLAAIRDQAVLRQLAKELQRTGHAVDLYLAAARQRPIEDTLEYLYDLLDSGGLRDAYRLLESTSRSRPVADIDRLTAELPVPYRRGLLRRTVAALPPTTLAELCLVLVQSPDDRLAIARENLLDRPPAEFFAVIADLADREERTLAAELVQARDDSDLTAEGLLSLAGSLSRSLLTVVASSPRWQGPISEYLIAQITATEPPNWWVVGQPEWRLAMLRGETIAAVIARLPGDESNRVLRDYLKTLPTTEVTLIRDAVGTFGDRATWEQLWGSVGGGTRFVMQPGAITAEATDG